MDKKITKNDEIIVTIDRLGDSGEGIAVYDKKVILFGSEGNAKIFSSKYRAGGSDIGYWQKNNLIYLY